MHIVQVRPNLRNGVIRIGEDTDDNTDRMMIRHMPNSGYTLPMILSIEIKVAIK